MVEEKHGWPKTPKQRCIIKIIFEAEMVVSLNENTYIYNDQVICGNFGQIWSIKVNVCTPKSFCSIVERTGDTMSLY